MYDHATNTRRRPQSRPVEDADHPSEACRRAQFTLDGTVTGVLAGPQWAYKRMIYSPPLQSVGDIRATRVECGLLWQLFMEQLDPRARRVLIACSHHSSSSATKKWLCCSDPYSFLSLYSNCINRQSIYCCATNYLTTLCFIVIIFIYLQLINSLIRELYFCCFWKCTILKHVFLLAGLNQI